MADLPVSQGMAKASPDVPGAAQKGCLMPTARIGAIDEPLAAAARPTGVICPVPARPLSPLPDNRMNFPVFLHRHRPGPGEWDAPTGGCGLRHLEEDGRHEQCTEA